VLTVDGTRASSNDQGGHLRRVGWRSVMDPLIIPATPNTVPSRQLPDSVIEQLAELWCEALLANLRRHPVARPISTAS
jgi:hypothetical protein